MTKAILFDAAGTLIHLPRGVGWHYREVAARHGVVLDETRLAREFGRAFKAAGRPPRTAGMPADDDKSWWRELVRTLIAGCGVNVGEGTFTPMFDDLYAHFAQPGVWSLYPEVIPVLEVLHGKYHLAIVSNFDRRLYPILEELQIRHFFKTITISSEVGADKPDPRIFHLALNSLSVTAADAIMVGDDPDHDWHGATQAGLRVYRVQRPEIGLQSLPNDL